MTNEGDVQFFVCRFCYYDLVEEQSSTVELFSKEERPLQILTKGMKRTMENDFIEKNITAETFQRPKYFKDYIGQSKAKRTLKLYIEYAKQRNVPLDHVLLYGPSGAGKTTLAYVIANEMDTNLKAVTGDKIRNREDLTDILMNTKHGDILLIEDIDGIDRQTEEVLAMAMENYMIDIGYKKDSTRHKFIELSEFTLICTAVSVGFLMPSFRESFGIIHHLEPYSLKSLSTQ